MFQLRECFNSLLPGDSLLLKCLGHPKASVPPGELGLATYSKKWLLLLASVHANKYKVCTETENMTVLCVELPEVLVSVYFC